MQTLLFSILALAGLLSASAAFGREGGPADFWALKWRDYVDKAGVAAHLTSVDDGFDWQYKERAEFSAQDAQYLNQLLANGGLLEAPDVSDFVSRLLLDVHPGSLPDGHPGSLHVRIEVDPYPNAYSLSNGMLIVTTGLLSLARSKDELRAVLAHELAHIYNDDRMQAKKAAEARAGFAAALSIFAGAAAGAIAGQSADPSIRAQAAGIGVSTAYTAGLLSALSLESMGFAYGRKQEKRADAIANEWVRSYTSDTTAFARILRRCSQWGRVHGADSRSGLMDTHPSTDSRLLALGVPAPDRREQMPEIGFQADYDASIAKVISREASIALFRGRYDDAYALTARALQSGWADANVPLMRASAMRLRATSPDSLRQALEWVARAEQGGCNRYTLLIERTVLLLRLGDEATAAKTLDEWLGLCASEKCTRPDDLERWGLDTRSQLRLRGH